MSSEQQILKTIRQLVPNSKKHLLDDAAIIEKDLVVTTDTLVENTHFSRKTYTPEEIGWKAMAINLSDIASMGGKPLYTLVALSLPKSINKEWVRRFYKGLLFCAKKYKTQIIGGNLTRAKEINISITLIGKIGKNIGKRSNAKPGDLVFTTGNFGDSACGLLLLLKNHRNAGTLERSFITKHKTPIPQIELGIKITKSCKRVALMDASDGLADCLIQICNESKVKIIVAEDKIPISSDMKKAAKLVKKNYLNLALYGGEDYELIGKASKNNCNKLKKIKNIKIIGEVLQGTGAFLKQNNNKLVKLDMKHGFKHFF